MIIRGKCAFLVRERRVFSLNLSSLLFQSDRLVLVALVVVLPAGEGGGGVGGDVEIKGEKSSVPLVGPASPTSKSGSSQILSPRSFAAAETL